MMKVYVDGAKATVTNFERLTSGMVGKKIQVIYSEEWNGLTKTATFTNEYDAERDAVNPNGIIEIPHEVLHLDGKHCKIAFYGYTIENGEKNYALPTIYADLGLIEKGAKPSAPTAPISPTVEEQLQADIDEANGTATEAKELAEDNATRIDGNDSTLADHEERIEALEEGGGGGGGTTDHRQLSNRDAANQHPMSAITGLTEALNGKQAAGDYATSGELDALADIVDGKADAADIPSLAGYATEQYVQNYHDGTKQDVISDLATIRSGAALGATALQSVPSTYRTASAQDVIDNGKVDKVTGKGLSTNDYTNEDKAKVASAVQPSDLDEYAKTADVPTQLSQLSADSTHRTVTDTEKSAWNGKQDTLTAGFGIDITDGTISVDLEAWEGGAY